MSGPYHHPTNAVFGKAKTPSRPRSRTRSRGPALSPPGADPDVAAENPIVTTLNSEVFGLGAEEEAWVDQRGCP